MFQQLPERRQVFEQFPADFKTCLHLSVPFDYRFHSFTMVIEVVVTSGCSLHADVFEFFVQGCANSDVRARC